MRFITADGILDLRSAADYQAGHLKESTLLPFESLFESLNQLPAAPAELFLVGDKDQIDTATLFLDAKGYEVKGSLVFQNHEDIEFWSQQLADFWCTGKESKILWKPSTLVQEFADNWLPELQGRMPEKQRPLALDIGCGGGRDAVFLAKQRTQVLAIDKERRVLKRAKELAHASGAQLQFKCCDLKQESCIPEEVKGRPFDIILGVRYLNRELLPQLKNQLAPGGYFLWQTFVDIGEPIESPKNPNFLLKQGELQQVFSGFEMIVDRIQRLDDGRPLNTFIARKPLGDDK
ncbi:methyltransferase domain-containing protein [Thiomicrorhabdus xiamenensis]|uniref:Methyltransferase domain-containing protein n=1 Tax=Thiomicrorhabdus xiamenensis TaxID=2739063 RepID=A0A7D4SI22_9GAMM|nr:methyltransferase domain-containing protein [Thiomicrorhabdus xiamenensis]QKI89100.1 methyltransferase domain-containing protein [Thiomicrorhabdus xiamenensis]